jgi:Protein of unknown function (DUF2786)
VAPSTDKLLERVRRLLALAESPNVHEAAAAAGRAQALITRYKLESLLEARRDTEARLSDGRDEPLDVGRKIRKYKLVLAAGLAQANGCVAYSVEVARREQHLCVAGQPNDQAAVAALWSWLVKRLEWLSATHGAGEGRAWHESFRIGAADTIVERLAAVQRAERSALSDGGQNTEGGELPSPAALVRLDAALEARAEAVERYAEERLALKKGRGITVQVDALEAGRLAGQTIALPNE